LKKSKYLEKQSKKRENQFGGLNFMDEDVILENSAWGARRKILLTNTQLTFLKKEGVFKTKWVVSQIIPLEEIEEAYVNTSGVLAQSSTVKLRMKNGEVNDLALALSNGDSVGLILGPDDGVQLAVRTKALCDRWASAINNQLRKPGQDINKTEMLEERIRQLEEKLKEKVT
jgi:hypothetical protein